MQTCYRFLSYNYVDELELGDSLVPITRYKQFKSMDGSSDLASCDFFSMGFRTFM